MYTLKVGRIYEWRPSCHPDIPLPWFASLIVRASTDDPEEAEQLWSDACERLREVKA